MNVEDQIRHCMKIVEGKFPKDGVVKVPFSDIISQEPDLGDEIDNNYEDFIKCLEIAYEKEFKLEGKKIPEVRVVKVPNSYKLGIGEIRKEHINKFHKFEGLIIRGGNVDHTPLTTKHECPQCGNILSVLHFDEDEELKEPTRCGCGRRGKFRLINTIWKNVRQIVVEEYIEDYTDKKARPTTIKVILQENLAEEKLTKKIQPGKFIVFNGVIRAKQRLKTKFFDSIIKAKDIEINDVSLFNMKISNKEVAQFKSMKKSEDIIKELSDSIFSKIEGQETVKRILTISRARGVKTHNQDGSLDQRDTINVFMIGDPGAAKTDMAKMIAKVDPIHMVVSGKGVSGAGLSSTTSFDKELGCWCIEPGAVPRCNKGSIVIDEIDKIDDKDTSSLNEGMVNLSFMTAKAGQQVELPMDVGIIGCANPDGRKFDNHLERYRQITLKPDFLDRFDIWVCVEKDTETAKQKKVIGRIISRFNEGEANKTKYSLDYIQKYYSWVIQTFKPIITQESALHAGDEISKLMNKAGKEKKSKEVSYRLVANVIRFAIGIAKLNQFNEVTTEHIDQAIHYQKYGFQSLGMLDETGAVTEETINFEAPKINKRKRYTLIDLISKKYEELKTPVTTEEIEKWWEEEGNDKKEVYDLLSKLVMKGDLFEPKQGRWRPI